MEGGTAASKLLAHPAAAGIEIVNSTKALLDLLDNCGLIVRERGAGNDDVLIGGAACESVVVGGEEAVAVRPPGLPPRRQTANVVLAVLRDAGFLASFTPSPTAVEREQVERLVRRSSPPLATLLQPFLTASPAPVGIPDGPWLSLLLPLPISIGVDDMLQRVQLLLDFMGHNEYLGVEAVLLLRPGRDERADPATVGGSYSALLEYLQLRAAHLVASGLLRVTDDRLAGPMPVAKEHVEVLGERETLATALLDRAEPSDAVLAESLALRASATVSHIALFAADAPFSPASLSKPTAASISAHLRTLTDAGCAWTVGTGRGTKSAAVTANLWSIRTWLSGHPGLTVGREDASAPLCEGL